MARKDLLYEGRAGARHTDNQDRQLARTAEPLLSGEEFDDCARWSVSRLEKRFLAKGNLKGEEGEEAFASFMGQLIGTTNDAPYISKITKAERTRRAEKAKALTQ